MPSQSRALTFAFISAAAALVVFGWLANEVLRGQTPGFDASIRDGVHAWAFPGLTYAMKDATYLASAWFVTGAGLLAVWRLTAAGRGRAAAVLAASTLGAEVLDQILKLVFRRPRPEAFFDFADPITYSFPSGHAFTSCCFYCLLSALLAASIRSVPARAGLWMLTGALVAAIGFSRVYLGVHYLSDVLAGYSAAVIWLAAVRVGYSVWLQRTQGGPPDPTDRIETRGSEHPPSGGRVGCRRREGGRQSSDLDGWKEGPHGGKGVIGNTSMNCEPEKREKHDALDDDAARLVAALDNLMEGEGVVTALVALGASAIGPLRRFLLEGRPSTVYQPRRWAVQALGGLDARDVLIEYLSLPSAADPQLRFAEEAVQNAAIREFLRWPSAETTAFLLGLSRKKMRAGLVEVFGKLRLVEAIPYLDRALQDDCNRLAAEEALVAIGAPAREALILSAMTRLPEDDIETPSSLRRRRSALHVLAAIGIRREDWPRVSSLVSEEDAEIVVYSCMLAVKAGAVDDRETVITRLIAISDMAPWFLLDDIADCLLAWFDAAQPAIQSEIERRMRAPEIDRVRDQCLRLLLRVMRRAQRGDRGSMDQRGEDQC